MKVLSLIPSMDDNKLSNLFQNAQDLVLKGANRADAEKVIAAIEVEWKRRLERFQIGDYKAEAPLEGVLKTIGYRVGNNGIPVEKRHLLLDFVMCGTLPPVGSPAHMAEWGEPQSSVRYAKLHRVIRVLASSAITLGNMEKAAEEWEEDLQYLEQKWRSRSTIQR